MMDIQDQDTQDEAFLLAALQWQMENGVDCPLLDDPLDKTNLPKPEISVTNKADGQEISIAAQAAVNVQPPAMTLGASEAKEEAQKLVQSVTDLEKLKEAIQSFEGITLKKTAMNMVFADGNLDSKIMVVGDKPNADSDREGKPFVGSQGVLLDRILGSIGLSRGENVYLTTLCNWRPPGDRSLNPGEIAASTPFLEKHIELVKPAILILLGDDAAKTVLEKTETASKLRGKFYQHKDCEILVTHHPETLLKTPLRKKHVWHDMLMLKEKLDQA